MLGGSANCIGVGPDTWAARQLKADDIIRALAGKRPKVPRCELAVSGDNPAPAADKEKSSGPYAHKGSNEPGEDTAHASWWERLAKQSTTGDLIGRSVGVPETTVIEALNLTPDVVQALKDLGREAGVSMRDGAAVYWLHNQVVAIDTILDAATAASHGN